VARASRSTNAAGFQGFKVSSAEAEALKPKSSGCKASYVSSSLIRTKNTTYESFFGVNRVIGEGRNSTIAFEVGYPQRKLDKFI
jgi:hypothetical protein